MKRETHGERGAGSETRKQRNLRENLQQNEKHDDCLFNCATEQEERK